MEQLSVIQSDPVDPIVKTEKYSNLIKGFTELIEFILHSI